MDALPLAALALATTMLAPIAAADWLVTREGHRIETQGPWEVRGRSVVFTRPDGELASLRLEEIDLEASRQATEAPPASPEPAEAEPSEAPAPVMVIDDSVVGRAADLPEPSPEGLAASLRSALEEGNVDAAMGLVQWGETPRHFRQLTRQAFARLAAGEIREVRLVESSADAFPSFGAGDKTYEPSVEITHQLSVELAPDSEDDVVTTRFPVGPYLGSYYIAVPSAR